MRYKNYSIVAREDSWFSIVIGNKMVFSAIDLNTAYQYIYTQEKKLGFEKVLGEDDFN